MRRRVVIMGAGGRDFHDFNVVFRDDPEVEVVAFTATQIPGIAGRRYPPSLAGPHYPDGIPVIAEEALGAIIRREAIDEVVFAYSDLSHVEVMHRASIALAAGADFRFLGPAVTAIESRVPVVAVCASRTGAGKSQTSRRVGRRFTEAGLRVSLVRHPMPYEDLDAMHVQRFGSLADIDRAHPTIEEREEYEEPVRQGLLMWAGVDYAAILARAEAESDLIVWDGGNNDTPFFRSDLHMVVVDPLRPGHEAIYHPGELNVRMADVVVVNKVDAASPEAVAEVSRNVRRLNPSATVVRTASPVVLEGGSDIRGARALVVEDGPTLTHGGMAFGAGTVAARQAGVGIVDPRPYAVGSLAAVYAQYPGLGPVLPAMGYGDRQIADLEATIAAVPCDVVIAGTPIDLGRIVSVPRPVLRARYESVDVGSPSLDDVLTGFLSSLTRRRG